jgi:transposase InsO family protein
VSVKTICELYGCTRQAWYKHRQVELQRNFDEQRVLTAVLKIRRRQPRVGTRKLHRMLQTQSIYVSRDKLFDILRENNMLIRPQKCYTKTTYSHHRFRKYKNLIRDFKLTAPNQIYVSDITYIDTLDGFCYLCLITDKFSRKIVGWEVHENESSEKAATLMRSICVSEGVDGVILHSDNGKPMKGATMLATLQKLGVIPSFSRPHVSNDNPYSESVFKTLKYTATYPECFETIERARDWVSGFVNWYNNEHHHSALGLMTPAVVHFGQAPLVIQQRQQVLQAAYTQHPERFVNGPPQAPQLPAAVWINPPKTPAEP